MASSRRLDVLTSHLRKPTTDSLEVQVTSASGATLPTSYCAADSALTAAEIEHYARHGFVVKRGLVDRQSTQQYKERFRQICSGEVKLDPSALIMRDVSIARSEYVVDEKAITKVQNFQDDEVLFGYCSHPAILPYVQAIAGNDLMSMHTMLLNKPPDTGSKSSRHPLHQDLHYFPFRPADRIVCAWTALQHVDRENGCLVVHPGSHATNPLLAHGYPEWKGGVNKMYHGIPLESMPPKSEMVHLEMEEGDTVFFHPLLIHGSGMNRTDGFRKAISCHYASSHCVMVDLAPTQKIMDDEVQEIARIRLAKMGMASAKLTTHDAWRIRARLVAGEHGSLTA
eukprot:scpid17493/ scgid15159/ Phytanoyl-CoA dioxygenase, peroxisomal; Phytanic acid oxidase; Phytanoyl-CoA alpha-hydroxylase